MIQAMNELIWEDDGAALGDFETGFLGEIGI